MEAAYDAVGKSTFRGKHNCFDRSTSSGRLSRNVWQRIFSSATQVKSNECASYEVLHQREYLVNSMLGVVVKVKDDGCGTELSLLRDPSQMYKHGTLLFSTKYIA